MRAAGTPRSQPEEVYTILQGSGECGHQPQLTLPACRTQDHRITGPVDALRNCLQAFFNGRRTVIPRTCTCPSDPQWPAVAPFEPLQPPESLPTKHGRASPSDHLGVIRLDRVASHISACGGIPAHCAPALNSCGPENWQNWPLQWRPPAAGRVVLAAPRLILDSTRLSLIFLSLVPGCGLNAHVLSDSHSTASLDAAILSPHHCPPPSLSPRRRRRLQNAIGSAAP